MDLCEEANGDSMGTIRVGNGYDVHKLAENRRLVLGGVPVPYKWGLAGHSDADVLTHAVMDALLGAAGLGDIGQMFPDTDEQFAGASSLRLLEQVAVRLRETGWRVGNIDATVVAQAPKLAAFREEMQKNIAAAITCGYSGCDNCDTCVVNVKFTTEEGLGFTGAKEGIAAYAVCLVTSG